MLATAVTASSRWPGVNRRAVLLLRWTASGCGGLLLYASFPPRTTWWLAVPAFALLGAALRGCRARTGFGLGYLFGLTFLLPLLVWTGSFVGWPWLFLPAFEALFFAVTAAAMAAVSRLPGAPLLAAAVWVAGEALRGRVPFGGFPWGKVAFGQPDGPLLPIAALGGAPLLSFAVVLTGLGLAQLITGLAGRHRLTTVAGGLATVLPLLAGLAAAPTVDQQAQSGTLTVALVQGNVPQAGLDFNAQRRAVLDNHRTRTEQLAEDVNAGRAPQPDLVLWPENAADIDPIRNADATAAVDAAATAIGAPILLGAILDPPREGPFNAVVQWEPGIGPTAQYLKRHVQPFGEYIPMRSIARLFSEDVERVRRPLQPGNRIGVLDVAGTRIAIATCFEVAFDNVVHDAVRAGGTVLAVPTNNATFGRTEMTYQQLAMSRVRAVEHSRAVLVAATSGVSAVIAPDGTVSQHTGLFTADALVADVPLRTTITLATRLGAVPEWLLVSVGVVALLAAACVDRHRGRPRSGQAAGAPDTDHEENNV